MLRLAGRVRRLARLSVPVLIRGETGTGKELVARALHELSARRSGPFTVINAGTLSKELAAAELFGHDRGAFTGAYTRRDGAFLATHGGTLFLDEIGELGVEVQAHLLRVLEQHEVRPVGSTESIAVDVRVVAATWAPLEQLIDQGRFREDLYHRLAVGTVRVPPLRERRSDISSLAHHFLETMKRDIGQRELTPGALASLATQPWKGNVRQLRNTMTGAAVLTDSEIIDAQVISAVLRDRPWAGTKMSAEVARAMVARHGGKVAVAARACGVARSTFRDWLDAGETERSANGEGEVGEAPARTCRRPPGR